MYSAHNPLFCNCVILPADIPVNTYTRRWVDPLHLLFGNSDLCIRCRSLITRLFCVYFEIGLFSFSALSWGSYWHGQMPGIFGVNEEAINVIIRPIYSRRLAHPLPLITPLLFTYGQIVVQLLELLDKTHLHMTSCVRSTRHISGFLSCPS